MTSIFSKVGVAARSLVLVLGLGLGVLVPAMTAPAFAEPMSVHGEWVAHPNLVNAVHAMRHAINDLERAPDDFGGNKARAISDLKMGIHSLKRAIFFRLHMDDAAIDAVIEE